MATCAAGISYSGICTVACNMAYKIWFAHGNTRSIKLQPAHKGQQNGPNPIVFKSLPIIDQSDEKFQSRKDIMAKDGQNPVAFKSLPIIDPSDVEFQSRKGIMVKDCNWYEKFISYAARTNETRALPLSELLVDKYEQDVYGGGDCGYHAFLLGIDDLMDQSSIFYTNFTSSTNVIISDDVMKDAIANASTAIRSIGGLPSVEVLNNEVKELISRFNRGHSLSYAEFTRVFARRLRYIVASWIINHVSDEAWLNGFASSFCDDDVRDTQWPSKRESAIRIMSTHCDATYGALVALQRYFNICIISVNVTESSEGVVSDVNATVMHTGEITGRDILKNGHVFMVNSNNGHFRAIVGLKDTRKDRNNIPY